MIKFVKLVFIRNYTTNSRTWIDSFPCCFVIYGKLKTYQSSTWSPQTIADIYKERWQIESFFRILKQNLKIETFVGTSLNAIITQIWTALIAMLTLKYLSFPSQIGVSLSNLMALFRFHFFAYRDL